MDGILLAIKPLNFNTALKKGAVGEAIVSDYLYSKNLMIFKSERENCSHPFDKMLVDMETLKFVGLVDVKTKPKRVYYPDTGINLRHWHTYLDASRINKVPFFLFFVDEEMGKIFWGELEYLSQERMVDGLKYPRKEFGKKAIVYFPISVMKVLDRDISQQNANLIRSFSQRSYVKIS